MKRTLRHSGRISQLCTNYNLTVFLCTFMYNTCSYNKTIHINAFPGGVTVKNLSANAGDTRDVSSIPGSGRNPGGGNSNTFQYCCLENSMDRGAWQATVHRAQRVRHD